MVHLNWPDGMYKVQQRSPRGVIHHAILDNGNTSQRLPAGYREPVIIHLVQQGIVIQRAYGTGVWGVMDIIYDEESAIARMDLALMNPFYNLAFNNCEHFSNYVAYGVRFSSQVQAAVGIAAMVGLIAWNNQQNWSARY
ncbi:MAG TPA: hypothetical protein VGK47_06255 [Nitrososphaeraceae archaeon]